MYDNQALKACLFLVLILKTTPKLTEMDSTTRLATTNKQVETVFKFLVVPFSGDFAFLRCTFLEILNSLKLR